MNVEAIKKWTGNGFRPFVLTATTGRRFRVPHPEFIMVLRRVVVVGTTDGFAVNIDPLHIVSIEPVRARKAK